MANSVVIAGGGASGVLLARALLDQSPHVRVTIIEPGERLGVGVAYATTCPAHLLNVPAAKMSAFPSKPAHFHEWLEARYPNTYEAGSFVPRMVYAEYLSEIARSLSATNRFEHRRGSASGIEVVGDGVRVGFGAQHIDAGAFVLATGNAAPATWPGAPDSSNYYQSAWSDGALVPVDSDETVLLLGTGLTAVDAVLGLRYNGHRGLIYMMSRRGLLPHEHRLFDAPPEASPEAENVRDLVAAIREKEHWRPAIDRMRPHTNELWKALDHAEQRRFVRHVLPYWNVHRHRMAPEVAKTIGDLIAADTVRTLAGRTLSFEVIEGGLAVEYRARGMEDNERLVVQRIINCSGPEHNPRKMRNPLISSMLASGAIVPYPLNLGIEVADDGALVDMNGLASTRLYAIGPVRYGTLIETTAIPEIRQQAVELAQTLLSESKNPDGASTTGVS